jgi:hypothetical protein
LQECFQRTCSCWQKCVVARTNLRGTKSCVIYLSI